jgi:hypothetical protein
MDASPPPARLMRSTAQLAAGLTVASLERFIGAQ